MARRLASFLLLLAAAAPLPAADFFVSPTGSDNAAGTAAAPFASLTRARDAIRTLKAKSGLPPEGITVWLRGGFHELSASLLLQEADAGTATAPIVYAAYPGEEVRLTGAKRLDPAWFSSVTSAAPVWSRLDPAARGQIVVADLPAHGITNFGALANRDAASRLLPLTLACDGRPLPLARWPNDPQEFALTQTVPALTQITYAGDRPSRWLQAEDPWVHGLWSAYWADFHLAVAAIDPATRTLTFAQAPASYGILPQRPFYAYNLLEELDQPGEYYLDRTTGRLYLWPTRPLAESTLQASLLEVQLVLVGGAAHVCFRDLVFEGSRTELVKVARGHDIRFERCLFRNGRIGANLAGTRNGLDQCEVVDCHEDGVVLSGGDRATLVPGENYVTNSRIHRVARSSWAYRPCVRLTRGCGQIVAHNLFDDHPHSAILFDGNDHRIEHNEIRRVCRLTADCGAIYTGRDWGYRGNRIAGNFIHHVTSLWSGGAHAVYLDDMVSGPAVEGNVIYRVTDTAIFCGGGRDLVMTNNLIAACGLGHYSGDYCRSRVNNTPKDSTNLLERLAYDGIKYQEDPWRTAYPACAAIPNDFATILTGLWRNPEGCVFDRNAGWDNKLWMREYNSSGTGVFAVYASIAGNDPAIPPLLADAAARNRALRPVSLAPAVPGFNPIAFAAIGRDGSAWPAATRPPPPPALSCRTAAHTVVELEWVDYANLPANQETGSTLERRLLPGGPWRTVRTYGPDTGFDTDRGLLPGRSYAYRLRATNAAGTALSPEVEIALPALFTPTAPPTRLEAEVAYTVVAETTTEAPAKAPSASPTAPSTASAASGSSTSATPSAGPSPPRPPASTASVSAAAPAEASSGPTATRSFSTASRSRCAATPLRSRPSMRPTAAVTGGRCTASRSNSPPANTLSSSPPPPATASPTTWSSRQSPRPRRTPSTTGKGATSPPHSSTTPPSPVRSPHRRATVSPISSNTPSPSTRGPCSRPRPARWGWTTTDCSSNTTAPSGGPVSPTSSKPPPTSSPGPSPPPP